VKKYNNGLIVGRFQPFHLEHLRLAVAAAGRVKHLWVGITRPFGKCIPEIGGARAVDGANPLPYWLRYQCVECALINDAGFSPTSFSILPVPLVKEIIKQIVPRGTVFLTTIMEQWGVEKEELFRKSGLETIRMDLGAKTISGTMIRDKIAGRDQSWKDFVPKHMRERYASVIETYVLNSGDIILN